MARRVRAICVSAAQQPQPTVVGSYRCMKVRQPFSDAGSIPARSTRSAW